MCFTYKLSKSAKAIEDRFQAEFFHNQQNLFLDQEIYNGFAHPKLPVISNSDPGKIIMSQWGLLPSWAKDKEFGKNTLNAKIETLSEKPSFKNYRTNRCLIPSDGFIEWQWLDPEGKHKKKYLLRMPGDELYAFAGLWNVWIDPVSKEEIHTYTIITTEANELLAEIHNSRKRMPVILTPEAESLWLKDGKTEMWNDNLIADPVDQIPTLF